MFSLSQGKFHGVSLFRVYRSSWVGAPPLFAPQDKLRGARMSAMPCFDHGERAQNSHVSTMKYLTIFR